MAWANIRTPVQAISRAQANSIDRKLGVQLQDGNKISRKYSVGDRNLKWNYRELASNEIVLDVDYDCLTAKDVRAVVEVMCDVFESEGLNYELYASGGKGFHFHLFFGDMLNYTPKERSLLRKYFMLIYGHGIAIDYAKKDENTVIGIEYARHRKGGKKTLIRAKDSGLNDYLPMLVTNRFKLRTTQKTLLWGQRTFYNDSVRVTKAGRQMRKPCITELLRKSKEYNINRHDTALLLTSALRGEGATKEDTIIEVQRYMDGVGYTDQLAEYMYEHSYSNVACDIIRDVLIGTSATHKCKNCSINKEYVRT